MNGTWQLLRLAWRRDRIRIPAWVIGLLILTISTQSSVEAAYPDAQTRASRALLSQSPATVMMAGPLFAGQHADIWTIFANELIAFFMVGVAIASTLTMVRHTRGDEEAGRRELVLSLPVGRVAPELAAILLVAMLNAMIWLTTTGSLLLLGAPADGAWAVGCSAALTGMFFGAVALVASQVFGSARSANGFALGSLGTAFLIRAAGDVMDPDDGSWLSWCSPLAWAQQIRAFADTRWWPLAILGGAAVVLMIVGASLGHSRDVGAGLIPERAGNKWAPGQLLAYGGLPWRLTRMSWVVWLIGLVALGGSFGSLAYAMQDMIDDNPGIGAWLGANAADSLLDSFCSLVLTFLVVGAACFAVQTGLRAAREESAGRASMMLISGRSRTRWLLEWTLVVVLESVASLLISSVALAISLVAVTEDRAWLGIVMQGSLSYIPALLVLSAVAMALIGIAPKLSALAWIPALWAVVVAIFADLFDLPNWARDFSAVQLSPNIPVEDVTAAPLIWLSLGAVALVGIGLAGAKHRNFHAS